MTRPGSFRLTGPKGQGNALDFPVFSPEKSRDWQGTRLVTRYPVRIRRRRLWPYYVPAIGLVVLAFLWTALWFRASNVTQETLQGWFDREGRTGRLYSCASPQFGGYPFRIEVHCAPAAMEWRSPQPTVFAQVSGMVVAAQVWQP